MAWKIVLLQLRLGMIISRYLNIFERIMVISVFFLVALFQSRDCACSRGSHEENPNDFTLLAANFSGLSLHGALEHCFFFNGLMMVNDG